MENGENAGLALVPGRATNGHSLMLSEGSDGRQSAQCGLAWLPGPLRQPWKTPKST
jgi:hypothetical protein